MRATVVIALALLSLVYVGLDQAWLMTDEGIQTTDAAYHFSRIAALRANLLGLEQSSGFDGQRYGGLVYYAAAWLSLFTGLLPQRLLLALSILLRPLLVWAVYRIGWELAAPGRRVPTGLLAAALTLMLPGLVNYGRVFVLDLPLTVAVTWALAFALAVLRADAEGDRRDHALVGLGLCAVAALLIKLNALAFLVGPLWVVFRGDLRRAWALHRSQVVAGAVLSAPVLGGLVAFVLVGPRGEAVRRTLMEATWPGALLFGYLPERSAGLFLSDWLRASIDHSWEAAYYTWLQTLTPPWALLGLASFVWFFARRHGCDHRLGHSQRDLAFWWFTLPALAVVFGLRGLYDERYVLPLLPLTGALIACAVVDVRPRWLRRAGVAIILVGGALNHGFVHHDVWPTSRPLGCTTVTGWGNSDRVGSELWTCLAYPEYRFMDRGASPRHLNLPVDAIQALLDPLREEVGAPLQAVFLDDLYEVFYRLFQSSLLSDQPLLKHEDVLLVTNCWDKEGMTAVFETPGEVDRQIRAADVVLMRYGSTSDGAGPLRGRRCDVFWTQTVWFEDMGEVELGDGTTVRLWKKVER